MSLSQEINAARMVMERETEGELYSHTTALLLYEQPRQQPLIGVNELLILFSIEICVSHKFTAGFVSYEFQSCLLLGLIQSSSLFPNWCFTTKAQAHLQNLSLVHRAR